MAKKSIVVVFYQIFILFIVSFSSLVFAKDTTKRYGHISYSQAGIGRPLILIHAFPTDQRLWRPQQDGLQKYFRVITLDLWGFGRSSPANGQAISMTQYADEVKRLMDQLHIEKAIIGGESMGGYVTLAFLKKYPEKVAGIILSDTQSIADSDEAKQKREAIAQETLKQGSANVVKMFMSKALMPTAPSQTKQYLRNIVASQSRTGIASALRGMALREDTSDVLKATTLPVLIITGKEDTVIWPQQSESMHALAKNSQLIVIPKAAHLSSLEQPAQWNNAVINEFYLKHS